MEYVTPVIALFKQIFTIEQQIYLSLMTGSISLGLAAFNNIYFSIWPTKKVLLKRGIIWIVALCMGLFAGWVNYVITTPDHPLWFRLLIGMLCGPAAIKIYQFVLWLRKSKK